MRITTTECCFGFSGKGPAHMAGLSLIELLISMVMALTLASAVLQIYLASIAIARDTEVRARMYENAGLAIQLLTRELRLAGALGCLPDLPTTEVHSTLRSMPITLRPVRGIEGWEAAEPLSGSEPPVASDIAVTSSSGGQWSNATGDLPERTLALPGSDILRVWQTQSTGATLASISQTNALALKGSGRPVVADGDLLLLSDCLQVDWVQACHVQAAGTDVLINSQNSPLCSPGNDPDKGLHSGIGGEVLSLRSSIFYIGKRGDMATNPPALFRRKLSQTALAGAAEELVEGIADMQFLYGVNLDEDTMDEDVMNDFAINSIDAYLPASQVSDWLNVISVRISLLVQPVLQQSSEDRSLPKPQTFTAAVALRARLARGAGE